MGSFSAALQGSPIVGLVEPYLLPSVAAVVIGGTSIFGGAGGYSGTITGALILTILAGLLTVINAPAATEQILDGALILVVTTAYARAGQRADVACA